MMQKIYLKYKPRKFLQVPACFYCHPEFITKMKLLVQISYIQIELDKMLIEQ